MRNAQGVCVTSPQIPPRTLVVPQGTLVVPPKTTTPTIPSNKLINPQIFIPKTQTKPDTKKQQQQGPF